MYLIQDQKKETIAYIENMMILDTNHEHVIGILIGDCFFGHNKKVVGKIINQTVYLINGEIVGKIELNQAYKNTNIKKYIRCYLKFICTNNQTNMQKFYRKNVLRPSFLAN